MASPVREGDVLADKYRVTRVLAEGGMGVVVAAQHLKLQQEVALKFMLPELLRSAEATGRFLREARAAVQLKSEHAARIIDICELDSGLPYIVMELLEGDELAALLSSGAPLRVEDAVDYVLQACEAIAEAHALGIVHRDLKPENLFVCRRRDGAPLVKVLDFGISKVTGGESRLSGVKVNTREAMGSPNYMSPEQMRSTRDVDGRADIWSLGVILYELVTGQQPFVGQSIAEVCLAVTQDPPPPLDRYELPEGLAAVILRCLVKDPDQRFATVADLVRALAPHAPRRSQASIASVLAGAPAPGDETSEPVWPQTVRPRQPSTLGSLAARKKLILSVAGAVLLAVLGWIRLAPHGPDAPLPSPDRKNAQGGGEARRIEMNPSAASAPSLSSSVPPRLPVNPSETASAAPSSNPAAPGSPALASKGSGTRGKSAASGKARVPGGADAGPSDDVFSARK